MKLQFDQIKGIIEKKCVIFLKKHSFLDYIILIPILHS